MHPRRPLAAALVLATLALAGGVASCGARTELFGSEAPNVAQESGADSPPEGGPAESMPLVDAAPDARDALPPIDVAPPRDAPSCPTGLTAYLFSQTGDLYSFDPPSLTATRLGPLRCPTRAVPWTLTASGTGMVYLLYEDWGIYEVDPSTLVCTSTLYKPGQLGFGGSLGFTVSPDGDAGERLYVYGLVYGMAGGGSAVLAVSDLTSFVLSEVGVVTPAPSEYPLDIRADPFGRIFGLGSAGTFDQIDPKTAALIAEDKTSFGGGGSWALLTYNDAIYFFSGGNVSQYDLKKKKVTPLGNIGVTVVGASAAPCIH